MYLVERIDDYGKAAWIALMVLGFIIWWPIGLAILGFLLWSRRMVCGHRGFWGRDSWGRDSGGRESWGSWHEGRWERKMERLKYKMERLKEWRERGGRPGWEGRHSSGNTAFDAYRMETLRRLEDEQRDFTEFLNNLRHAKDKAEFDQFMAERRNGPQTPPPPAPTQEPGPDTQQG
jgi:hypothetical protein